MNLVCQDVYNFQMKMELFTQCPHSKIYRVAKTVHISIEKYTNLVSNQHCSHFKCMKVNILGKCIIKIPNLQEIMVSYNDFKSRQVCGSRTAFILFDVETQCC